MEVDIEQAAQLLGRSQRQVMRYIEAGKVQAHKDNLGRWRIDVASLEKVGTISRPALDVIETAQGVTIMSLLARIERLEAEVSDLRNKAVLRSYAPTSLTSPGAPRAETSRPSASGLGYTAPPARDWASESAVPSLITSATARPDLPAGTIRLIDMAKLHDVPSGTLKSQAERRTELATGIPTAASNGRQERWATPEQQRAIVAFWRSMGTQHARCNRPDCACQE